MGCCFSSKRSQKHQQNHQNPNPKPTRRSNAESRNLDPPVAEEFVKEVVLSETPLAKPPLTPLQEEKPNNAHVAKKLEPEREPEPETEETRELFSEISMVSESCEREVSESFSYSTTTTVTEVKDDDEAMSKRRRDMGPTRGRGHVSPSAAARRKRSNSGEIVPRRGRGRGHVSPAGRFERSASKRNRTEVEPGRVGTRRDPGEVSSRRSRSPATRSAGGSVRGGVGRGGSRVTGRGGGRSGDSLGQKGKEEEGCNSNVGNSGESLENPLVAMECFIFV